MSKFKILDGGTSMELSRLEATFIKVIMQYLSVCAAPTCSHQSFDGSSYYVDVDVDEHKLDRL